MQALQNMMENLTAYMTTHLPTLLQALAVLVVGWIVARVAAALVRRGLTKTSLDNRLAAWLFREREDGKPLEVEAWAGQIVFYILMLFVLVGFFQVLGLSAVTEPLNAFLVAIFGYLPRLLGPALLALAAWVVGSLLRFVVKRVLESSRIDERLADKAAPEGRKSLPLSQTLSESVYWLVWLLFLPAILGPLGLDGLLEPVQNLVDQLLGFLPKLLAAGLILVVGWLVARILQRLSTSLLAAAGADSLAERVGVAKALGKQSLSGLVGMLVYVLILLPVAIASLEALGIESITQPATQMLNSMLLALPQIFAAALVLGLAYLVGRVVGGLVANLLAAAGFDSLPARLGLMSSEKKLARTPSETVGSLLVLAVMLFAATEAARLIGFEAVGQMVSQFTVFAGQVVLGVIIFGLGIWVANFAASAISGGASSSAGLLAMATRVAILIFTGAMALRQMGIANEIINLAFGLTLGAVAVAAALAFGLGARDAAAKQVANWQQALQKGKKE